MPDASGIWGANLPSTGSPAPTTSLNSFQYPTLSHLDLLRWATSAPVQPPLDPFTQSSCIFRHSVNVNKMKFMVCSLYFLP
ncbi:unnamed protein product [Protopolystoma xenopodis]|uniref:Uncharacterized protein n=1 Tax=Protopolystoma xenopodis TaxID=117903 RepID=A0A3S4ZQ60_9PLAT|nr:unnamed protein product [Protopolystoma xenopodis]